MMRVAVNVINPGLGAGLFQQNPMLILCEQAAHLTVFIGKIAKDSGSADTGGNTGRFQTLFQPVCAEGAFIGITVFMVDIAGIIRTGRQAGLATYTSLSVYLHGAIIPFMGSAGGTGRDALGVVTMIAKF